MDNCEMEFTTKASLRYHLLKHEGQKEYTCGVTGCGKTFLTLSQLKQHENSSSVHRNVRMNYPVGPYESNYYREELEAEKRGEIIEKIEYENPWSEDMKLENYSFSSKLNQCNRFREMHEGK